jgi:hypothetical protein
MPSATTTSVWKRPQRSRSSRAGIVVSTSAEEIAITPFLSIESSANTGPHRDSQSLALNGRLAALLPHRSPMLGSSRATSVSQAGLRKHAENLEQDGGGRHAGDAPGVEGRRDLDEIGADEIEAPEIAGQTLGFKCRETARLWPPCPWRIDRIE